MSAHTPGPWLIADNKFIYALGPHGQNAFSAHFQSYGTDAVSPAEVAANTRLAAAAPDLLESLRDCADALLAAFGQVSNPNSREGWSDDDAFESYQRATAAIARSTGAAP